ncbi:MAG: hypothetical protein H6584_08620 [Flavobacteriales bacterium]|nr:hypothetical protein [Flavobacteriales bacterium]
MRNGLITLLLVLASLTYGQESYYYSGWGKIRNSKNEVVSSREIKTTFVNEFEIIQSYRQARTEANVGNVLMGGGFGFALGYTASAYFGPTFFKPAPVIGGVLLGGIGVAFRMLSRKTIKETVDEMNNYQRRKKYQSYIDSSQIIVNSNGIGLSVSF